MSVEDLEEVWERAITVARVEHSNRCSEIPRTAKLGFSIGSCSRSHEAREQGEDMCLLLNVTEWHVTFNLPGSYGNVEKTSQAHGGRSRGFQASSRIG